MLGSESIDVKGDIDDEKIVEKEIAEMLTAETGNPFVMSPDRQFYEYDFRLDTRHLDSPFFEIRYEVKDDKAGITSGNVAIEYKNGKNISGIFASQSDFYIIIIGRVVYIIPRNAILYEIFRMLCHEREKVRIVNGGDYGKSRMFLLPISTIKEMAIKVMYRK